MPPEAEVLTAPAPEAPTIDAGQAPEAKPTETPTAEDAIKGALSRVRNKTEEAAAKLKGDDLPNKAASKPGSDEPAELSPQQKGAETRRKNKEAAAAAEAEAKSKAEKAETNAKIKDAEARAEKAEKAAAKAQEPTKEARPAEKAAESTDHSEAPSRFSPEAKADWESTPETVREQSRRMETELTAGIEKYRERAEKYDRVEPYEQLAAQFKADLPTVLDDYKNMSEMMRRNPVEGINYIAERHGLSLTELAESVLGVQSNEAYKAIEKQNVDLRNEVRRLQVLEQNVVHQRQNEVLSHIDQARLDNPDFDALEPDILYLLKKHEGLAALPPAERLKAAITRARNLVGAPAPATPNSPASAQTADVEPANEDAQTVQATKTVKGSATSTSADRPGIPVSAEDAVKSAFRKMRAR